MVEMLISMARMRMGITSVSVARGEQTEDSDNGCMWELQTPSMFC